MKTITQTVNPAAIPTAINPDMIVMSLLIIGALVAAFSTKKVPLLSSARIDLVILIVLGMAMCTQGGIGCVAALNAWAHPLAIVGYILGAAILLVAGAVFFNVKMPFITDDRQALLLVAGLIGLKVLNSVLHNFLTRG